MRRLVPALLWLLIVALPAQAWLGLAVTRASAHAHPVAIAAGHPASGTVADASEATPQDAAQPCGQHKTEVQPTAEVAPEAEGCGCHCTGECQHGCARGAATPVLALPATGLPLIVLDAPRHTLASGADLSAAHGGALLRPPARQRG